MNEVNKTLYIPLYGKALVSKKGIILQDAKAEEIWEKEGFALKGKAASKWLAYYMGMRSRVFDQWLERQLEKEASAVVLHMGCGMDSRVCRVGTRGHKWYDIDFPEIIAQRKQYYGPAPDYEMIPSDALDTAYLNRMPGKKAIVIMEGVSMYLKKQELITLMSALGAHFESIVLLMDCYTVFAARASRYKNPVNEVGVTTLYGIDDPLELGQSGFSFVQEHSLTPPQLIGELKGFDRWFFRTVFAGSLAKKIYRLYEFTVRKKKNAP